MTRLDRLRLEYCDYLESMRNNFVYHDTTGEIIRLDNLDTYTIYKFNFSGPGRHISILRNAINAEIRASKSEIEPLEDIEPFLVILDSLQRVTKKVYVFGEKRLLNEFEINGSRHDVVNLYKPALIPPPVAQTDADVAPFLAHVRAIAGDSADILLDWMAWIVQNPTQKVRWAPLVFSEQGIGKDTFVAPLHYIFGAHNSIEVDAKAIESAFNVYDKAKLVVLNEMSNDSRYSTYDKIKPKISGTGSGMVYINDKNEKLVWAKNVSAWIVFSNHPDAMPMEAGDRRFYVVNGHHPVPWRQREAYFAALWNWYNAGGGFHKLFGWMLGRDVTAFNPNQPPADTDAKREMAYKAMTPVGQWVCSQCEVGVFRHREVVMAKEVIDLAGEQGIGNLTTRKISEGMRHAGFSDVGSRPILPGVQRATEKTTWYARGGKLERIGPVFTPEYRNELINEMSAISRNTYFGGGPDTRRREIALA